MRLKRTVVLVSLSLSLSQCWAVLNRGNHYTNTLLDLMTRPCLSFFREFIFRLLFFRLFLYFSQCMQLLLSCSPMNRSTNNLLPQSTHDSIGFKVLSTRIYGISFTLSTRNLRLSSTIVCDHFLPQKFKN